MSTGRLSCRKAVMASSYSMSVKSKLTGGRVSVESGSREILADFSTIRGVGTVEMTSELP